MTYDQHTSAYEDRPAGGLDRPWLTGLLLIVMVAVYGAQVAVPGFTEAFIYSPILGETEKQRWITAGFLHSPDGLVHLGVNAIVLWSCGAALENVLGRWRFPTIFLVSVIGGHYAVSLLNDPAQLVLGASGGIFGLFAALLVTKLPTRIPIRSVAGTIALNTALGFVIPDISWEAHLGLPRPRRLTNRRLARQLGGA